MKRTKRFALSAAILSFLLTAALLSPSFAYAMPGPSAGISPRIGKHMQGKKLGTFRNRKDMRRQFKAVHDAIERGDYEAWAALMSSRPNADTVVNKETFERLREMHALLKEGDRDGARKIAEELGMMRFTDKKQLRDFFRQIHDAIKNNDYDTWAKLMNEHPKHGMDTSLEAFERTKQHRGHAMPHSPKPTHPPFMPHPAFPDGTPGPALQ